MKLYSLKWVGAGPLAFAVVILSLSRLTELNSQALAVLGITVWMVVWWVVEAVPLAVTALLPLVAFPMAGVLSPKEASAPYGDELIFLFLGGFLIAAAVEKSGLHRRIALQILSYAGGSPRRIVGGFLFGSAALSMWISNSATAMMLLPVGLSVAERMRQESRDSKGLDSFEKALLIAIAYGASIGGVGTLIGTPPNMVLAGAAQRLAGRTVDFAQWLIIGLPLVCLLLPLAWLLLTRVAFCVPDDAVADQRGFFSRKLAELGNMTSSERVVALVFLGTAVAWIFRASKQIGTWALPGLDKIWPSIGDSTIALVGALLLFVWPIREPDGRKPLLTWDVAPRVPWGVLLLFGGGLCLSQAFQQSGLDQAFARAIANIGGLSVWGVTAAVTAGVTFLTEFTSNTATAAMLMPLLAATAQGLGQNPLGLMIAGAVASSFAFCLPVATPPNAIIYASGRLTVGELIRVGIFMNIIAFLVWFTLLLFWVTPVMNLSQISS